MIRPLLLSLVVVLAFAALACEDPVDPSDVAGEAAWSAGERAEYVVLDGDKRIGQGVFTVDRQGDAWVLRQQYDAKIDDDVRVEVAASDLKPRKLSRTIDGNDGKITFDVSYENGRAVVHADNGNDRGVYGADVPAYAYDNWQGLFLWRTLPLRDGYTAAYRSLNTAAPRDPASSMATVRVEERERIYVPAGEFDTWRIKVSSGGGSETAWIGIDSPHPLVRYDNGSAVFELQKFQR